VADVSEEAGLRLARRARLSRALVEFGVERDDTPVGGFELLGQLGVERDDATVGLLQFGVEAQQVIAVSLHLFEGGQQLTIVLGELLHRRPGMKSGDVGSDRLDVGWSQRDRTLRNGTPHRHRRLVCGPIDLPAIHEALRHPYVLDEAIVDRACRPHA
jgi:hypothetical protein